MQSAGTGGGGTRGAWTGGGYGGMGSAPGHWVIEARRRLEGRQLTCTTPAATATATVLVGVVVVVAVAVAVAVAVVVVVVVVVVVAVVVVAVVVGVVGGPPTNYPFCMRCFGGGGGGGGGADNVQAASNSCQRIVPRDKRRLTSPDCPHDESAVNTE